MGLIRRCAQAVCSVVERVVAKAAVQDADESIAEGTQGLMMKVAGGAVLVVERSGRLDRSAVRIHRTDSHAPSRSDHST